MDCMKPTIVAYKSPRMRGVMVIYGVTWTVSEGGEHNEET